MFVCGSGVAEMGEGSARGREPLTRRRALRLPSLRPAVAGAMHAILPHPRVGCRWASDREGVSARGLGTQSAIALREVRLFMAEVDSIHAC